MSKHSLPSRPSASTAMLYVALVAGSCNAPVLLGQTPANAEASPAIPQWSPAPDASAVNVQTPADLEAEQERLVLNQEELVDNREDLEHAESAVAHMNQSALSVETESTRRSGRTGALEVSGGYLNNLYDRATDKIGSGFSRYSLPMSYNAVGTRTLFQASYVPELSSYSAASSLYQSHTYEHTLLYSLGRRTTLSWQLAVAHYRDVGQFLPAVLPVGGGGIAQPVGSASNKAGISTVSNLATSFTLQHRSSPRDEITYTATAAWTELLQLTSPPQAGNHQVLRNEPYAADIVYEHALSPSTFVGAEGTLAYVRGLSTSTRLIYESALGTMRYTPAPNDTFSLAGGPLILQTSGVAQSAQAGNTTYAVNANYAHRSQIATVGLGYARIVQLSIDNTALPAHQLYGTFMRPLTRNIDFTVDSRYIHAMAVASNPAQTSVGGALRLDYRTHTRLGWFLNASGTYVSQSAASSTATSFNRNEISGGFRFSLDGASSR
jgi:hypothetical protein